MNHGIIKKYLVKINNNKLLKKRTGCLSSYMFEKDLQTYIPEKYILENYTVVHSEFVIMEHHAKKAGLHYDLRIKNPKTNMWYSFAIRKGIPKNYGVKHLAIKTNDHTEEEALLIGRIEDGQYGAGVLKLWEKDKCNILINNDHHMLLELLGNKVKGLYHLFQPNKTKPKDWLIFKSVNPDKWRP